MAIARDYRARREEEEERRRRRVTPPPPQPKESRRPRAVSLGRGPGPGKVELQRALTPPAAPGGAEAPRRNILQRIGDFLEIGPEGKFPVKGSPLRGQLYGEAVRGGAGVGASPFAPGGRRPAAAGAPAGGGVDITELRPEGPLQPGQAAPGPYRPPRAGTLATGAASAYRPATAGEGLGTPRVEPPAAARPAGGGAGGAGGAGGFAGGGAGGGGGPETEIDWTELGFGSQEEGENWARAFAGEHGGNMPWEEGTMAPDRNLQEHLAALRWGQEFQQSTGRQPQMGDYRIQWFKNRFGLGPNYWIEGASPGGGMGWMPREYMGG